MSPIPRLFRVEAADRYGWWVLTDGHGVMSTIPGESLPVLLARWQEVHGRHPGGYLESFEPIAPGQIGDVLVQVRTAVVAAAAEGGGP